MNYSFMSFSCPDLTLDEMLAVAKELGYDAIEPRGVSNHAHGVEPDTDAEQRAACEPDLVVRTLGEAAEWIEGRTEIKNTK